MIPLLSEMSIDPALLRGPAAALSATGEPAREGNPFAAVLAAALPAPPPAPPLTLAATPAPAATVAGAPEAAPPPVTPLPEGAAPAGLSGASPVSAHLFPDRPLSPRLPAPQRVPEGLMPKPKIASEDVNHATTHPLPVSLPVPVPVPQLAPRPVPVTLSPPLPVPVPRPGSALIPAAAAVRPAAPVSMTVPLSAGMRQSLAALPGAGAAPPVPYALPVPIGVPGPAALVPAPTSAATSPVSPLPAALPAAWSMPAPVTEAGAAPSRGIAAPPSSMPGVALAGTVPPLPATDIVTPSAAPTTSAKLTAEDSAEPVAGSEEPAAEVMAVSLVAVALPAPVPAPALLPAAVAVPVPIVAAPGSQRAGIAGPLPLPATLAARSNPVPLPPAVALSAASGAAPANAIDGEGVMLAPPILPGDSPPLSEAAQPLAPVAEASASTAPAAGIAQAAPVASAVPVDPRGEARVQPQQDAAIDQIADLQGAARASRPEMLLRHAEFGTVSIKVEGSGPQDWRAVLASRDPGFVPAVQAALTERMIAGATATDLSGNTPGQNPSSDPRYGSSPGSGQGSSQPYMHHQQGRDEGAFGHERGQSERSTRSSADGGDEAAQDPAATHNRGLFA